jgi:acyl-CoA thioesterase-2
MTASMNNALAGVIKLLDLKKIAENTYVGGQAKSNHNRIYGGQVVSQALMAAQATVEGRPAISLKSDFLRPGDPEQDVIYKVENVRDGRSFNTRRVTAVQTQQGEEKIIFTMSASFQLPEKGVFHQIDMADFPLPTELPEPKEHWERIKDKLPEHAKQWFELDRAFEERAVEFNDPTAPEKKDPYYAVWFKANGTLNKESGEDNNLHQGLFAYVSDMCLLDTCILPHGISWMQENFQSASLDHSIWFHRDLRVDEWLLFVCDSPSAFGGRGFNRASVYNEEGLLVASVIQEGLIRVK